MKRLLLIIALLLGLAAPAQATPADDPPQVPEAVADWFADKAQATVRSYGADAFPDFTTEELTALTVGDPELTSVMGTGTTPDTAIQPSARWIAPIMNGDTAVGAVSVNFDDGVAGDEIVRGDARLGTSIARDEEDTTFVWDAELSAWFIQRDSTIEPADDAGAKIVLGAVPINDFLAQRSRILSSSDPVTQPVDAPVGPVESEARSLPLTVALVLAVLAILVGSLVWLRAEQQSRDDDDEGAPDELANVERKGVVGTFGSKTKFRDSGTKVNVYRTKKAKDDSELFDD